MSEEIKPGKLIIKSKWSSRWYMETNKPKRKKKQKRKSRMNPDMQCNSRRRESAVYTYINHMRMS